MKKVFSDTSTGARFIYGDQEVLESHTLVSKQLAYYTLIWATEEDIILQVEDQNIVLKPNQILALTPMNYLKYTSGKHAVVYKFNREFYCIKDHDAQVGCTGVLFFGTNLTPIASLDETQVVKYNALNEIILEELQTQDSIQEEMLRVLIGRLIIKTTRLIKNQDYVTMIKDDKLELLRSYNLLVEEHFRHEHSVVYYASLLNKSPKTISNYFSKYHKSPLQIIHDRIVLEVKRLLTYSDKSAKEIAYIVGFEDASHLSRLFKKQTGISPTAYKKQRLQAV